MEIKVTRVSVTKKGVVYIQAKVTSAPEELKEGDVFSCHFESEEPNKQNQLPKTTDEQSSELV